MPRNFNNGGEAILIQQNLIVIFDEIVDYL